ncbi:MAG: hypothetical protein H7Z72_12120 [Bacteroidetes bacterium]|nr:hypothetical protein [Fibrella sp.]
MKQIMALFLGIMLLTSSLVPRMSTEQAARLPELVRHYHQHQREEGSNLSFWAFIVEHYASDSEHQKSPNHSHNRLPSFDGGMTGFIFTPVVFSCIDLSVAESTASSFSRVPVRYARQFFASLLQPPRRLVAAL